ncbi:urease accessory protein [Rhizobiales bacterium GAS113]|nr:urease accessory protein [Rhizobiales bacterium GAS113]
MNTPGGCSSLAYLLLFPVTVFLLGTPADAHILEGEAGGFFSGLQHPISGWDHILAMVSVGLWGAQLGAPAIWLLPVTFPLVMAFGGFLGLLGVPFPSVEIGIALSALLLGAAVMTQWRPPLLAAAALVGAFALFHGHAHGAELPPGESGLLYSIGFVVATGCLHLLGISIGTVHKWAWGRRLLQAAGAGVAMGGVYFLTQAFA